MKSKDITQAARAKSASRGVPGFYPLLLSLLLLLVYAPLVVHPTQFLYPRGGQATDLTITHWPAMAFNAQSLHEDGQIPLWRPPIAGGGPWLANPQSWLTYPPAWLSLVLPPAVAINVLLIAHLALAALGTYGLGRSALALSPAGAALAGLAFAASPWLSGHLSAGHLNILFALAWLPVALNALHRVAREGRLLSALVAGTAWAAALVNHLQTAAFILALSAAWFLFVLLRPPARPETGQSEITWKRRGGLALLVPLVSTLLSAVLLLPLAEALPYLNRTGLSVDEAGTLSLAWPQLLTLLIPTYGGQPEQVIYLGVPILLLAATGLLLRRDAATWFLTASAAVAVLFALGTHTPLFPFLARLVPGLGWLRVPPRAWVVVALAVALLAGRGLDALARTHLGAVDRRRTTLMALVALVVGLTLAAGLALIQQPIPLAAASLALLTLLAVAAILLRARGVLSPAAFAGAMLVLAALDLGAVRQAWTEMVPEEEAFRWGAPTAAYLAEQPGLFRTYSPDYSLPQHVAVENGLYLADGVDPIQLRAYAHFLATAGGYTTPGYSPSLPPVHGDRAAQPDARLLGRLNVRYVAAGYPIEADGLTLRTQAGGTYVYENEYALPRAFTSRAGDPVEVTTVTKAEIDTYTPNEIVVTAQAEEPGLLVLSEVCYPGWQVRVDGVASPVSCFSGLFRAVAIDPGQHTVIFQYHPWSVRLGAMISAATLAGLLIWMGHGAWREQ
ncbi:MAG: YfhO family protein [Anaerolineae bacterium]|nr:YfhO family protein [Anaerolineae bacterium]